jgi:hypothetical protein
LLVGGIIIHSLLSLSIDKNVIVSKLNSIVDIWPTIKYMIIDEISMVSCNMLVTMHLKLQKKKSNILPFGGINIMFMEDFLQFPPITNTPLYSKNVQPTFAFTKMTPKKIIRKSVWENYIHLNSIILIE